PKPIDPGQQLHEGTLGNEFLDVAPSDEFVRAGPVDLSLLADRPERGALLRCEFDLDGDRLTHRRFLPGGGAGEAVKGNAGRGAVCITPPAVARASQDF